MMALCRAEGIGVLPWSPLARGRLTRPWQSERHEASARRTSSPRCSTRHRRRRTRHGRAAGRVAEKRGLPRAVAGAGVDAEQAGDHFADRGCYQTESSGGCGCGAGCEADSGGDCFTGRAVCSASGAGVQLVDIWYTSPPPGKSAQSIHFRYFRLCLVLQSIHSRYFIRKIFILNEIDRP